VIGEPFHAILSVAEPFVGPGGDPRLVLHLFVELLGKLGSAFADDEATVFRAVGQEVDKALQAAEAGLERILVLVRPWNVLGDVCSAESEKSAIRCNGRCPLNVGTYLGKPKLTASNETIRSLSS